MLAFLLEIFGELLLQIFAEALVELGLHFLVAPFQKQVEPWVAAVGYAMLGGIVGGLSLLVFPSHFVQGNGVRILNLLVTPVLAGILMSILGFWRARRGQMLLRIDRFAFGYLFAIALALVRHQFAK